MIFPLIHFGRRVITDRPNSSTTMPKPPDKYVLMQVRQKRTHFSDCYHIWGTTANSCTHQTAVYDHAMKQKQVSVPFRCFFLTLWVSYPVAHRLFWTDRQTRFRLTRQIPKTRVCFADVSGLIWHNNAGGQLREACGGCVSHSATYSDEFKSI